MEIKIKNATTVPDMSGTNLDLSIVVRLTRKLTWRCRGGALAGDENSTKIRGERTRRGGVQVERKVRLNARKATDEPNPTRKPSGAFWASSVQEGRTDEADEEREERDQSKKMNDSTTAHA